VINGNSIATSDGRLGRRQRFSVRRRHVEGRLVVESRSGRKVPMPPAILERIDPEEREFSVTVRCSRSGIALVSIPVGPSRDRWRPTSTITMAGALTRQRSLYGRLWLCRLPRRGKSILAIAAAAAVSQGPSTRQRRSASEVTGYHILASDGEIGHVTDFLLEDADWSIRYLVVDRKNW